MTINEMANRLHIKDVTVEEYIEYGIFPKKADSNYDESDEKRLSYILGLQDVGMDVNELVEYFAYDEASQYKKQISVLRKCRSRLLEKVHDYEANIRTTDYFIHEIEKKLK